MEALSCFSSSVTSLKSSTRCCCPAVSKSSSCLRSCRFDWYAHTSSRNSKSPLMLPQSGWLVSPDPPKRRDDGHSSALNAGRVALVSTSGKGFDDLGSLSNTSEHGENRLEGELMCFCADAGRRVFNEHNSKAQARSGPGG
jgi:hypothetical protein